MIVEDQSDVIVWLARQSTQPNAPDTKRIETHISEVFLTGDRAYKLSDVSTHGTEFEDLNNGGFLVHLMD